MNDADPASHPCLRCGACCATYRVSFYWADGQAHGLPEALTLPLTPWHACMAGTQARAPRCVALDGEIGRAVACRVYVQRPSPCRELQPGEDKCQRARLRHGLPPLGIDVGIDVGIVAAVDAGAPSAVPATDGAVLRAPPVVAPAVLGTSPIVPPAGAGDAPAAAR